MFFFISSRYYYVILLFTFPCHTLFTQLEGPGGDDDSRRAIWLETRELDQAFKEMVFNAVYDVSDASINIKTVKSPVNLYLHKSGIKPHSFQLFQTSYVI